MADFELTYQVTAVFENGEESAPGLFGSMVSGVTAAATNPVKCTKTAHGLSVGDVIQLDGFAQMTELNGRQFTVDSVETNTFELAGEQGGGRVAETAGGGYRLAFDRTTITSDDEDDLASDLKADPYEVNWLPLDVAVEYVVYKKRAGAFGFMARVKETQFEDDGSVLPDLSREPPNISNSRSGVAPDAVGYYQQRRLFAGSDESPDTWFASKIGNHNNFLYGGRVLADGPIEASLAADGSNKIQHIVPGRDLFLFTADTEWVVRGSIEGAFTAENIQQIPQSYVGCSHVAPVKLDDAILFERAYGGAVYSIRYSYDRDGYTPSESTLLSKHLFTDKRARQFAPALQPNNLVLVVMGDGTINALTFNENQDINAWTWWDTDGFIESATSVPNPDTGEDDVYVVVHRYLAVGETRYNYRSVERLHRRKFSTLADAFFLDAGLSYDGDPVTMIDGLEHLRGREVKVLADGAIFTRTVDADGEITLDTAASKIHVGLPYTSVVETLRPERPQGTIQGTNPAISEVAVRFNKSSGASLGVVGGEAYGLLPGNELFTGDLAVNVGGGWSPGEVTGAVRIEQTNPLPITVLAVIPRIEFEDSLLYRTD